MQHTIHMRIFYHTSIVSRRQPSSTVVSRRHESKHHLAHSHPRGVPRRARESSLSVDIRRRRALANDDHQRRVRGQSTWRGARHGDAHARGALPGRGDDDGDDAQPARDERRVRARAVRGADFHGARGVLVRFFVPAGVPLSGACSRASRGVRRGRRRRDKRRGGSNA